MIPRHCNSVSFVSIAVLTRSLQSVVVSENAMFRMGFAIVREPYNRHAAWQSEVVRENPFGFEMYHNWFVLQHGNAAGRVDYAHSDSLNTPHPLHTGNNRSRCVGVINWFVHILNVI